MVTEVTPVMIPAPTIASLQDHGYQTYIVTIKPEELAIGEDEDGNEQIAAWEPFKPAGEGWLLHSKDWTEGASIIALWARRLND